jgi:hypothetical protein
MRDGLKVLRIDTGAISAGVVDLYVARNDPHERLVGKAMCRDVVARVEIRVGSSVTYPSASEDQQTESLRPRSLPVRRTRVL